MIPIDLEQETSQIAVIDIPTTGSARELRAIGAPLCCPPAMSCEVRAAGRGEPRSDSEMMLGHQPACNRKAHAARQLCCAGGGPRAPRAIDARLQVSERGSPPHNQLGKADLGLRRPLAPPVTAKVWSLTPGRVKVTPLQQLRSQTAVMVGNSTTSQNQKMFFPISISAAVRCCPPGRPPGQAPRGDQKGEWPWWPCRSFPACMNRTDVLLLVGAVYYQLGNHQQCIAFNDRWGRPPSTAGPTFTLGPG